MSGDPDNNGADAGVQAYTLPFHHWKLGIKRHSISPVGAKFCPWTGAPVCFEGMNFTDDSIPFGGEDHCHSAFGSFPFSKETVVKVAILMAPTNSRIFGFSVQHKASFYGIRDMIHHHYLSLGRAINSLVFQIFLHYGESFSIQFHVYQMDEFLGYAFKGDGMVITTGLKATFTMRNANRFYHPDIPVYTVQPSILVKSSMFDKSYLMLSGADYGFVLTFVDPKHVTNEPPEFGGMAAILLEETGFASVTSQWIATNDMDNNRIVVSDNKVPAFGKVDGRKKVWVQLSPLNKESEMCIMYDMRATKLSESFSEDDFTHKVLIYDLKKPNLCNDPTSIGATFRGGRKVCYTALTSAQWGLMVTDHPKFLPVIYKGSSDTDCSCWTVPFSMTGLPETNSVIFDHFPKEVVYAEYFKWNRLMSLQLDQRELEGEFHPLYLVATRCQKPILLYVFELVRKALEKGVLMAASSISPGLFPTVNPDCLGIGRLCVREGIVSEEEAHDLWLHILSSVSGDGNYNFGVYAILDHGCLDVIIKDSSIRSARRSTLSAPPRHHLTLKKKECVLTLSGEFIYNDGEGVMAIKTPPPRTKLLSMRTEEFATRVAKPTPLALAGFELIGVELRKLGYEPEPGKIDYCITDRYEELGCVEGVYTFMASSFGAYVRCVVCLPPPTVVITELVTRLKARLNVCVNVVCGKGCKLNLFHSFNNSSVGGVNVTVGCDAGVECVLYSGMVNILGFCPTLEQFMFLCNSKELLEDCEPSVPVGSTLFTDEDDEE